MLQTLHPKRLLSVKTKERLKAVRQDALHRLRQRTADERMLPSFIIIGAQKCGTSSLYGYLAEHRRVASALTKEVHYFDLHIDQSIAWYQAFFPKREETPGDGGTVTGEATPYYMHHPHVARRMAATLPDVKLIVLLRNPIDRTYSAYHHQVRKGREHETFENAIQMEAERLAGELEKIVADETYYSCSHHHFSYLDRSIYHGQLSRYYKFFCRDRMLVLDSTSLYRETAKTYAQVLDFLELDPYRLPDFRNYSRQANTQPMNPKTRVMLADHFAPHNKVLFEMLGQQFDWG